jgi:hypothetical protein
MIVTCQPSEIPCRLTRRCDGTNGENAAVPATSLEWRSGDEAGLERLYVQLEAA